MDGDGEDDAGDLRRDRDEVDLDGLVVAVALAGEVVTGVLDGAVGAGQVVVEDEVLVGEDLAGLVAEQGAGVEVVVGAGRRADVPAEPDKDRGQPGGFLAERDIAALGQGNAHGLLLLRFVLRARTGSRARGASRTAGCGRAGCGGRTGGPAACRRTTRSRHACAGRRGWRRRRRRIYLISTRM